MSVKNDLEKWVVRDRVAHFGGKTGDVEWSMDVHVNPHGLYFSKCAYGGKTEFVGMYQDQQSARQAGFQKLATMLVTE